MGPGGSEDDPQDYDTRNPPRWDGVSKSFREYKEELENWMDFTKLPKKSQGPAMISRLQLEAKSLAMTIPREQRTAENGAQVILRKLEEAYKESDEYVQYIQYKNLVSYKRTNQSIATCISGFLARAEKIKATGVQLPDSLLTMMLIGCAGLTKEQENSLFGACSGKMDLQTVSSCLKQIATSPPTHTVSDAYTATKNPKECTWCKKRGFNFRNHDYRGCFRLKRRNEELRNKRSFEQGNDTNNSDVGSSKSISHHTNGEEVPKNVWHFMSIEESDIIDPMIDTCAQRTLIGAYTLSKYTEKIRASGLKREAPMSLNHRFGKTGDLFGTLYSVHVPIPLGKDWITVQADVIPGKHPFLVGYPTLKRMKAKLNIETGLFSVTLGARVVTNKLDDSQDYPVLPVSLTYSNDRHFVAYHYHELSPEDLHRVHNNTGHANYRNMEILLKHAGSWKPSYKEQIESIIRDCKACELSGKPKSAIPVDISHLEPKFNEEIEIDILYVKGRPFLHVECKKTRLSETHSIPSRTAATLWNTFLKMWVLRFQPPRLLQGDNEFKNDIFTKKSKDWGIQLGFTAAEAHHQNGIIERGNGLLKAIFERIDRESPTAPITLKMAHATLGKNLLFGSNTISSYELVYRIPARVNGRSICLPQSLRELYLNKKACRMLSKALKSQTRKQEGLPLGTYVYFYRDNIGYKGPGKVIHVERNVYTIDFEGKTYTSSYNRLKKVQNQLLEYYIDENQSTSSSESDLSDNGANEVLPTTTNTIDIPSDPPTQISTDVQHQPVDNPLGKISKLYKELVQDESEQLHEHYATKVKEFYSNSGLATPQEFDEAFKKEYESWVSMDAFEVVNKTQLPHDANTISSHTLFKWKDDGTPYRKLKARIVPHGNKDTEKQNQRTDSPSIKPEVMKLILSLAAENGYSICLADIKTAFLQTQGINREIYVKPPREANAHRNTYWKLKKTTYGLVDGPIVWFNYAQGILKEYGITFSAVDKTLGVKKDNNGKIELVLGMQVDDFLYAGTPAALKELTAFLKQRFIVGSFQRNKFMFCGVSVIQAPNKDIVISQEDDLTSIPQVPLSKERAKQSREKATEQELKHYQSLTGSLLWIGTHTVPHLKYVASMLAQKNANLLVKDLKNANSLVRYAKTLYAVITFPHPPLTTYTLVTYTDASSNGPQEGCIVFKMYGLKKGSIIHPLVWHSRKTKKRVISTLGHETLSCIAGFSTAFYIKHLLIECLNSGMQGLTMVVDSRSLFDNITTSHQPDDDQLKVHVAILRQAFDEKVLNEIIWTPGKYQLADSLTKENRVAVELLKQVLVDGILKTGFTNIESMTTRNSFEH